MCLLICISLSRLSHSLFWLQSVILSVTNKTEQQILQLFVPRHFLLSGTAVICIHFHSLPSIFYPSKQECRKAHIA